MKDTIAKILRLTTITCVMAIAIVSWAGDKPSDQNKKADASAQQSDETWIGIRGTVSEIRDKAFMLEYETGGVLVEVDQWDWYDKNSKKMKNATVTVYGVIDDDFFEKNAIDANSVFIEGLDTHFFAGPEKEDGSVRFEQWVSTEKEISDRTILRGKVSKVSGRTFTVNTGRRKITIDTSGMEDNPLDDKGSRQIKKGDYIGVTGDLDKEFWEKKNLKAKHVITLADQT